MKLHLFSILAVTGCLAGCVIETDPQPTTRGGGTVTPTPSSSATTGGSNSSGSSSNVAPMLVDVDTNQTMAATPGDGVGVFIEYKAGGSWHVWWTCDTNKSQATCNFKIGITASSAISNITQEGNAQPAANSGSLVSVATTTGSTLDGVSFSTDAGAVITLDASVDGLQDGSFVFFVQKGVINGGYTGKLTNPLKLEGNSP